MAGGIVIGRLISQNGTAVENAPGNFSKMQEIIGIIDREYVDPVERKELFEKTISDMLHKLDPHSNYIPAENLALAKEQIEGKFGGVGIRFLVIRDTICVTDVIENSPSERVGVQAGDRIIRIGQKTVAGVKIKNDMIMDLLRGDEGTPVKVTLLRDDKQLSKTIVRGAIPIASISCATMLDKETGYIRLDQFSVNSAEEFHNAARMLLNKGMKRLVFDLRENSGGVLNGAVEISDEFLPAGAKILKVKTKRKNTTYTANPGGLLESIPVALLINENSASASEIVAGALQDNDRATIVGRRSFGKGLVQQDFLLSDRSSLRLTIARYYTPSGRSIQKEFDGDYEHYYHEQRDREENGELFHPDSTVFDKSEKFKTVGGRTVYGGGGIMPDIFVPVDTSSSTFYYVELRYSPAFQQFAFDFVQRRRSTWKNEDDFLKRFNPDAALMDRFVEYAAKTHKVERNAAEYRKSYELIRRALKAEIARQLFADQGYFTVITSFDNEVRKATESIRKP